MFNIFLTSDIHLEMYDEYPGIDNFISPDLDIDIICLCGDIGNPSLTSYETFLRECSERAKHKTFVILGNHEMYGNTPVSTKSLVSAICQQIGDRIVFLDNSSCDVGTKYRFIGTTLWSELDMSEAWNLRSCISDFMRIKGWGLGEHKETFYHNVNWLRGQMWQAEEDGKELVVMTHHVPLLSLGHPKYKGSDLQSAFASDLSVLIKEHSPTVKYWFYGHDHYSMTTTIDNTCVMSNQFGYTSHDEANYNPALLVRL